MSWLHEVLTDEEIRRFQKTLDFDGATHYEFARVRINLYQEITEEVALIEMSPTQNEMAMMLRGLV